MHSGLRNLKIGQVVISITEHKNFLIDNNLQVTIRAVGKELDFFQNELLKKDQNAVLESSESDRLREIIDDSDKTLDSELGLREAYILTEKRFDLKKLLNNVGSLFPKDIFKQLPDTAKLDCIEAGKCLAFELPTASAFHLMRATEATFRIYYEKIVKKKRLKNPLWGPMTDELRKKQKSTKILLDSLDHIRVHFRNPTSHPEKIYLLDEAQDLFSLCIDILNRLTQEINRLSK